MESRKKWGWEPVMMKMRNLSKYVSSWVSWLSVALGENLLLMLASEGNGYKC